MVYGSHGYGSRGLWLKVLNSCNSAIGSAIASIFMVSWFGSTF